MPSIRFKPWSAGSYFIDALIAFIRTHPDISSEATLRPLRNRTGLYFYDIALIRPLWVKGKPVLRLEKYTETITSSEGYNPFDLDERMVCEDVSKMSETKLEKILAKLNEESTGATTMSDSSRTTACWSARSRSA
jgi:hypothetical protein